MRHSHFLFLLVSALAVTACSSAPRAKGNNDYLQAGVLWFQGSGESRALQYQAFHLARRVFDADLKAKGRKGRRAVIVDVDETVLDNSPYQARIIRSGENYPQGWDEWIKAAKAKALAGAVEFLSYAHAKGARIFYVTNRKDSQKEDTAKNLAAMGFPDVTPETVVCRTKEASKEARRQAIRKDHRVVLLMGDNLHDFDTAFEEKAPKDRVAAVDRLRNKFGEEYIVIPNPMYGDWEAALYEFNYNRSDEEKDRLRKQALEGF